MAKYYGISFKPFRQFTSEEKDMTLAEVTKHLNLSWDFTLGIFDSVDVRGNPQKIPYNHEYFYKQMGEDGWADIFLCELNGKYYVPCTHTVMEVRCNAII